MIRFQKTFCALTQVSSLKSNWISKASALQRKGRSVWFDWYFCRVFIEKCVCIVTNNNHNKLLYMHLTAVTARCLHSKYKYIRSELSLFLSPSFLIPFPLSVSLFVSLYLPVSPSLSVSVSLSVCLSVSFSPSLSHNTHTHTHTKS